MGRLAEVAPIDSADRHQHGIDDVDHASRALDICRDDLGAVDHDNLLVAVGAGVPDVRRQARDVPPLDGVGGPGRGGGLNAVGSGNCHGASIAEWRSAAARGRFGGRPPKLDRTKIAAAKAMMMSNDLTTTEIAHELGVAPSTLFRHFPGGRSALQTGMTLAT